MSVATKEPLNKWMTDPVDNPAEMVTGWEPDTPENAKQDLMGRGLFETVAERYVSSLGPQRCRDVAQWSEMTGQLGPLVEAALRAGAVVSCPRVRIRKAEEAQARRKAEAEAQAAAGKRSDGERYRERTATLAVEAAVERLRKVNRRTKRWKDAYAAARQQLIDLGRHETVRRIDARIEAGDFDPADHLYLRSAMYQLIFNEPFPVA